LVLRRLNSLLGAAPENTRAQLQQTYQFAGSGAGEVAAATESSHQVAARPASRRVTSGHVGIGKATGVPMLSRG